MEDRQSVLFICPGRLQPPSAYSKLSATQPSHEPWLAAVAFSQALSALSARAMVLMPSRGTKNITWVYVR